MWKKYFWKKICKNSRPTQGVVCFAGWWDFHPFDVAIVDGEASSSHRPCLEKTFHLLCKITANGGRKVHLINRSQQMPKKMPIDNFHRKKES